MGMSFHVANDLSRMDFSTTDPSRTDLLNRDTDRKDTRYSSRAADRSRLLGALAFQALIAEVERAP
jgi:hypothetical protein